MTSRAVLHRERQTRYDICRRIGTKILRKEGHAVEKSVQYRHLHEKGLQCGEDQKEQRRGGESAQLEALQADLFRK